MIHYDNIFYQNHYHEKYTIVIFEKYIQTEQRKWKYKTINVVYDTFKYHLPTHPCICILY